MNFGGVIHLNKTGLCTLCGIIIIIFFYFTSKQNSNNNSLTNKIDLHNLLQVAIKAAENGGKQVFQMKDNIAIHSKGLTKEGLEDRVTTADFLSHCSMVSIIKHFYPLAKIISEEANTKCDDKQSVDFSLGNSKVDRLSNEYVDLNDITIWIDPLDATQEYTEKLYDYVTTMVCIAIKDKPIIGVIHKPFKNETFWVWGKAKSSNLNLQNNEKKESLKIIVSRSHPGKIKDVLENNLDKKFHIITAGGAGYKTLEVARGQADAYLHITAIKKWDICAGNAIVNALDGHMTTKYNKEIDYSGAELVNEEGLIVALKNHNIFVGLL